MRYSVNANASLITKLLMLQLPCDASRLLQLGRIKKACCKFMVKTLTTKNCIGYLLFAEEHDYPSLLQASQDFVLMHHLEVAKTSEFQALPKAKQSPPESEQKHSSTSSSEEKATKREMKNTTCTYASCCFCLNGFS